MEEAKLDAHSDWVRDVAWAPSVGLKRQLIASCSQDRRVIIWANDGAGTAWTPHELPTFSDVIWHVSWAVTGNILAVSGGDNKVGGGVWVTSLRRRQCRADDHHCPIGVLVITFRMSSLAHYYSHLAHQLPSLFLFYPLRCSPFAINSFVIDR